PGDTSAFDAATASGNLSDFTLVVPNDCDDGHDPCPGGHSDPVRQFDSFLARELPKIQSSPGWDAARDVIAITWDEGGDPPQQPAALRGTHGGAEAPRPPAACVHVVRKAAPVHRSGAGAGGLHDLLDLPRLQRILCEPVRGERVRRPRRARVAGERGRLGT